MFGIIVLLVLVVFALFKRKCRQIKQWESAYRDLFDAYMDVYDKYDLAADDIMAMTRIDIRN